RRRSSTDSRADAPTLASPEAEADTGADTATAPPEQAAPAPPPETTPAESIPELERPESAAGRMVRLRARLARSGTLGSTLLNLLSRGDLSEADWEEIEETLLLADVGAGPTDEL